MRSTVLEAAGHMSCHDFFGASFCIVLFNPAIAQTSIKAKGRVQLLFKAANVPTFPGGCLAFKVSIFAASIDFYHLQAASKSSIVLAGSLVLASWLGL